MTVIVPRPTVQLNKLMGTTSSNWSSETPNPRTPQALLISETSRNCNYNLCENLNLRRGESLSSHLLVVPQPLVVSVYFYFLIKFLKKIFLKLMSFLIFGITLCLARDQTRFGPTKKKRKKKRHEREREREIHAAALKSHKRWLANVITPCAPPQKDIPLMLD